MPTIKIPDYYIGSETDIPEKYKEEVFRRIDRERGESKTVSITPGKVGQVITSEGQLKEVFNDKEMLYLGHGTQGDASVINSIFKSGLKVKDPEFVRGYGFHLEGVNSTTNPLGIGNDGLFDNVREELNNWPHRESENIVIISLPKQYLFTESEVRSFFVDAYEQFYIGNEESGYKLRPEFIKGVYNSTEHSFTLNENFYKNFSDERKEEFLKELDDCYVEAYAKNVCVAPGELERETHLDSSMLDRLSIEWYTTQLERLREYEKELESIRDEVEEPVEDKEDSNWREGDEWS